MSAGRRLRADDGQAGILLLGILLAIVVGTFVLGAIARGVTVQSDLQRAADLGALAGAKAMHEAYPRLFQPVDGLSVADYTALGRRTAEDVARRNGAERVEVAIPADDFAPTRIAVTASATIEVGERRTPASVVAEAELAPVAAPGVARSGDEYAGPLAYRDGKPMRPDVAQAYDRMAAAAQRDGVDLVVTSGFRSNAEQAKLFAANPDPKWVARPGTSLHRLGTELDLGPAGAGYAWLAANAKRFGFIQRYSWEPWHWGYVRSAGTRSVGYGPPKSSGAGAVPSYVPAQYRDAIRRAAQRWSVGAALISAQIYTESAFRPDAVSNRGALGIAQFMPATARAYGIDPLDPEQAIDGQAHYMHNLLKQVGSVPLALAAYNAGPARVLACGCTTPVPETARYVAKILALLDGKFDPVTPGGGLAVRLVR